MSRSPERHSAGPRSAGRSVPTSADVARLAVVSLGPVHLTPSGVDVLKRAGAHSVVTDLTRVGREAGAHLVARGCLAIGVMPEEPGLEGA
ncbi:hypothetical protein [Streptomyces sp. NPDC051909]|uniref:hypothetical protein n=1 Tax=Streptomyces sp. NPDC051909 TaxID=3154944 RepID=UPI0034131598